VNTLKQYAEKRVEEITNGRQKPTSRQETMELMTLFYSDLTKTLNPVTSFEKAQKEMRAKYPTDPEKWAGFVLVR